MKNKFKNVPDKLKACKQWVCWKYVANPTKPKKPKKRPIDPTNGKSADVSDPDTWATFKTALKRYKKGDDDGIGFVFTKNDPYVGIDLDNCRDTKTGKIKLWAREIINDFASYTEISPSGSGVHILAKGKLPGKGKKVGDIEMYDQGRYFTVTGETI